MQAFPAILLQHPQLYLATIFKTALLPIAIDIYLYVTNQIQNLYVAGLIMFLSLILKYLIIDMLEMNGCNSSHFNLKLTHKKKGKQHSCKQLN